MSGRRPKQEHLAEEIGSEVRPRMREMAKEIAADLFANVDSEHKELRGEQEQEYIRAIWPDARKRMDLLTRLAPDRPDGTPDPDGARLFWDKVLGAHGWDKSQIRDYLKTLEAGAPHA